MKPPVMPEVELTPDDTMSVSIERHPAYAEISAARVTGGQGTPLYGSDFGHHDFIIIEVRGSVLHRGLSRDWYSSAAGAPKIELAVSEAQWATFLSAMNGASTPCTLRGFNGEEVPGIAEPPRRKEQFKREMAEHLREAQEAVKNLETAIDRGAGKRELRSMVTRVYNALIPNVGFVADQFNEHVETVTEHAKSEVNAYILGAITRTGIAALKGGSPIALPEKKEEDPT